MQIQCSDRNATNAPASSMVRNYRTARAISNRSRSGRRRGQALLMAVLLMVFAALLGSTFVTVVALNLNQTGRQQDVTSARSAAQAGLLFTNKQLTDSIKGEKWRPEQVSPPPAPYLGDPASSSPDTSYNVYYTPFEQAQGWARTVPKPYSGDQKGGDWDGDGTPNTVADDWAKLEYFRRNHNARVFVKFPSPLLPANADTPTYLVEVKYVPKDNTEFVLPLFTGDSAAFDPNESPDKGGQLRVTVIGESQDNSNVFFRRVSYKPTASNGSPLSFAYYTSNWDTNKNRLVATKIKSTLPISNFNTLPVYDASGIVPGETLLLNDSSTGDTAVIVQSVDYTTNIITLDNTYLKTYQPNATVRVAGTLMQTLFGKNDTPTYTANFDADGINGSSSTYETIYSAPITSSANEFGEPFNAAKPAGGMFFNGGLVPQERVQMNLSSAAPFPSYLSVAGKIVVPAAQTQAAIRDANIPSSTPVPLNTQLTPQSNALTSVVRADSDPYSSDPSKNPVKPLSPPQLDDKLTRYQQLTKYSDVGNGSLYGYGTGGVYIDNADDFEKVVTANGSYRALSISDMQRLWQRKSFFANTTGANPDGAPNVGGGVQAGNLTSPLPRYRLAWKSPSSTETWTYPTAAGSLEERGVRGWVSPYEFMPRGATILLNGNQITIIRDDRSDALFAAPDLNKAWQDRTTGNRISGAYSMTIDYSTSNESRTVGGSTILNQPFNGVIYADGNVRVRGTVGNKDLTIVSAGNIYVDGAIRRGGAGHIALIAKKNVTLNPTQFLTHLPGQNDPSIVTDPTTKEIFYNMTLPGGNTPNTTEQIGRDFRLDDTTVPASDYYLTMQHAGEMKNAFDLTYPTPAAPNPAPTPISITIKDPSPNTPPTVIDANEKHFAGSSSTGQDFDINLTDLSATPTPTANQGSDGTANSLNTLKSNAAFSTPTGWQMTLPAANGTLPARRIASLKASNVTTTWLPLHVPLTVSVGVLSNPGANFLNIPAFGSPPPLTIGSSFSWNGSNPPPTYDPTIQGYWEDVGVLQPTPTPVAGQTPQSFAADTTVGEPFYQIPNPSNPNGRLQAHLQWMSRKLSTTWLPINDNAIGFMRDPAETLWPTGVLPGYRLGYFKIERALSGLTPFQANQNFAGNTPGVSYPEQALSYTVQATIMAQEGSWFVIPMPLVPRFDVNGDGNTTDAQDLAAATRFRRLNYQVFVLGNIAQNHSPTTDADYDLEQDPDGRPEGAMRLWVDSLSYPHDIDSAGNGQNWRTITYAADPIPANNNLYLPVTPDIAYTG